VKPYEKQKIMESKNKELITLIENAITVSNQVKLEENFECLNSVINRLQKLKIQVSENQLPPSKGILTLGLSRGVADWVSSLDSPLLKAVGNIEKYYQQNF
jgi:hypothetical protein